MLRILIFLFLLIIVVGTAHAHLASDSYLRIEIEENRPIRGQWDIALRDLDVTIGLDADQDGAITWGELRANTKEIEDYAFGRLTLTGKGGACGLTPSPMMVDRHAGYAYAVLPFVVECPSDEEITLHYRLLFDLDPSHRGLLTIAGTGVTKSEVLTPDHADILLDRGPVTIADQIVQFLIFGFEHILLGYDHLLFIVVLLVMAALRRHNSTEWVGIDRLRRVLVETIKILTAFTLAHAIVLTPAVLGVINVPARLVEPAVAMTIMLAAVDNLRPVLLRLRWQVAFCFGLIHGLSFASVLGPMRLPPFGFAVALVSFNTGVEAGQIALALLLVPIVFVLRDETAYRRLVAPGISLAAFLLAGVWFVDRVFALNLLSFQPMKIAGSGI